MWGRCRARLSPQTGARGPPAWAGLTHLHVPLFAQCVDHAALNGPATGPTDGDTHFVMAWQAVELPLQLTGLGSQLLPGRQVECPGEDRALLQALYWSGSQRPC